ncbi:MAG: ATP-binding protein, partial [Thermoprotei archaeon]
VVWGRDLIWRGKWVVNPQPITDDVGGPNSLAHIARKNHEKALVLLKNRYLILLTRGTKGVYIYFEDKETKEYVKSLLN